jgi:hypothetical protein
LNASNDRDFQLHGGTLERQADFGCDGVLLSCIKPRYANES